MVGLPVLCAAVLGGLASAAATEAAASPPRKPPMGFSSWNHFGMGVTAPLLLDVADAFESTGLHEAGYVYINTDDGWNQPNRTQDGALEPCSHFTNSTMKNLTDSLHAKGFKFGIYEAAGFTTCGHRAGTLYHERADAFQFKAWGVDCKFEFAAQ
jgi:alpha-galactosidase